MRKSLKYFTFANIWRHDFWSLAYMHVDNGGLLKFVTVKWLWKAIFPESKNVTHRNFFATFKKLFSQQTPQFFKKDVLKNSSYNILGLIGRAAPSSVMPLAGKFLKSTKVWIFARAFILQLVTRFHIDQDFQRVLKICPNLLSNLKKECNY